MKKKVIITILLISVILIIGLVFIASTRIEDKKLTKEEKIKLLEKITIEKENILTVGDSVTIEAIIKNNNSQSVKVKKIYVTLIDENNKVLKKQEIKISKKIKPNSNTRFSKTVLINNDQRTFTKYDIEI